jgi:hypothetical protein
MSDSITLTLTPVEFAYLQRAVDRDRTEYESILTLPDCDDVDATEAARSVCMQNLLRRVEDDRSLTD